MTVCRIIRYYVISVYYFVFSKYKFSVIIAEGYIYFPEDDSKPPVSADGMFRWAHLRSEGIVDVMRGRNYIQDDVSSRQ